jgi:hypothetical protein
MFLCLIRDIEQVAHYGVVQSNRRSLAYAVKQMLAREIDVQKMRLYEASLGNTVAPPSQTNQSRGAAVESKAVPPPAAVETPAPVPNHIGQLLKMKTEIGADALTAAKVSRWIISRNDGDDGSRQ